ncbi:MAG: Mini-ribonuclease 3 [Candidatus Izimaplasma sp.]|nr:Mini-ribonuclease 3 [Candidatus Izimaplasma bacterium]
MIQYNGLTLAYLGDAIYEVYIREFLLAEGYTKVDKLHKKAITYTSAKGQKIALDKIFGLLSENEINVFKRGRNASTDRKPRNTDLATYKQATGFEALIGFLYLNNELERLEELINIIKK